VVIAFHEGDPVPAGLRRPSRRLTRGEGGQELLRGEAEPAGPLQALTHEALEAPGGPAFARGPPGDEGAAALVALDEALALEIRQRAGHRARIDPKEAGKLADRGQLCARLEGARRDEVPDLGHEVRMHRDGALRVYPEAGRWRDSAGFSRQRGTLGSDPSRRLSLGARARQPAAHPDEPKPDGHPQRLAIAGQILDE